MYFKFTEELPQNYNSEIPIISGSDSISLKGREYLIVRNEESRNKVFEIKYEYTCSPFKEAKIIDDILAVGHEEHFYLFNLNTNQTYFKLKVDGYFGHLYFHNELFYVTDACGVHCIDKNGKIIWHNHSLAIDGVILNSFEVDKILGSGECDPPEGWENFMIDIKTGQTIQ